MQLVFASFVVTWRESTAHRSPCVPVTQTHCECDKIVRCLSLQSASLKTDDRCHVGPTAVRNMCVGVCVCGTVYQPQPLSCYLFLCPLYWTCGDGRQWGSHHSALLLLLPWHRLREPAEAITLLIRLQTHRSQKDIRGGKTLQKNICVFCSWFS